MKYLPILDEVVSSDSILFMIFGLIIALVIGLKMREQKKLQKLTLGGFLLYIVCEILLNFRTNFFMEMIVLFVGTIAIGCTVGFLFGLLITNIRKR